MKRLQLALLLLCVAATIHSFPHHHSSEEKDSSSSSSSSEESKEKSHNKDDNHSKKHEQHNHNSVEVTEKSDNSQVSSTPSELPIAQLRAEQEQVRNPDNQSLTKDALTTHLSSVPNDEHGESSSTNSQNRQFRDTQTNQQAPPSIASSTPQEQKLTPQKPVPYQTAVGPTENLPEAAQTNNSPNRQARDTDSNQQSPPSISSSTAQEQKLTPQKPVPYQTAVGPTENLPEATQTNSSPNRQARDTDSNQQSPPSIFSSTPQEQKLTPQKPVPYQTAVGSTENLPEAAQTNSSPNRQTRDTDSNQQSPPSILSSTSQEQNLRLLKPVPYQTAVGQTENLPEAAQTNSSPNRQARDTDSEQQSPPSILSSTSQEQNLRLLKPVPYQAAVGPTENLPEAAQTNTSPNRQARDTDSEQQSPPSILSSTSQEQNLRLLKPVPYQTAVGQTENLPEAAQTNTSPNRQTRDTDSNQKSSILSSTPQEPKLTPQKPVPYQTAEGHIENLSKAAETNNSSNRQARDTDSNQQSPPIIPSSPQSPSSNSKEEKLTSPNDHISSTAVPVKDDQSDESQSRESREASTEETTEENTTKLPDEVDVIKLEDSPPYPED